MEFFVFLLYIFAFVVALMPLFIYRELRRQGRQRADEATRLLHVLRRIDRTLSPELLDDEEAAAQPDRLPSGRRVILRRT